MSVDSAYKDFESYLRPITQDNPAGDDCRYEAIYDQIKDARRQDDTSLPQGVWQHKLKYADWSKVEKLCDDVLMNRSKDLQVAAWLAEAWLYKKGLRGLGEGVNLMHALSETFWDSVHPQIDEDGADYRLAPVNWLNEKMAQPVSIYHISNPENEELRPFTLSEYKHLQVSESKSKKEKAISDHGLQESVDSTADYYYEVLYKDALDTISAIESFENYLTEQLPNAYVSIYQLRMELGSFRDFCLSVIHQRGLFDDAPTVEDEDFEEEPLTLVKEAEPTMSDSKTITSRQDAYRRLNEIAVYLEAIEPHSPTPYLLKKAVQWGNMPLSQLFQEFLDNNMDIRQLQSWLGMPDPQANKNVAGGQE